MTREIKFRAWDRKDEEMREVAMLRWEDDRMSRIAGYWKGTRNNGWTDYDPADEKYILMQFVGLKDKNGKPIYEGDICRVNYGGDDAVDIVKWFGDEGYPAFDLSKNDHDANGLSEITQGTDGEIEVIGNIYENPDLIK